MQTCNCSFLLPLPSGYSATVLLQIFFTWTWSYDHILILLFYINFCVQKRHQKWPKLVKSLVTKGSSWRTSRCWSLSLLVSSVLFCSLPPSQSPHFWTAKEMVFPLTNSLNIFCKLCLVDFKKLHEAHFNKMESIDSYVQRKTKQMDTYRSSVKELKVLKSF